MSSREFDVVVVGAGTVGLTLACLLVSRKLADAERVAVVAERLAVESTTAEADWDHRVFALSRASERALRHAGIWERLPANRLSAYERMCVWDASGTPEGAGSLTFDCAEIGEPNLGFIAAGLALQSHALQAARDAGVVLIEASVRGVEVTAADARIRLHDGRELASRLLAAADGTESTVRTLLGIDTAGHGYSQDALVANVRTERPHRNTAWQRFLPTGPLAFLPLPDGRSSIVWSAARGEAERLRGLDAAAFGAALCAGGADVLGRCELTTPVSSFPLRMQTARSYAVPRAVLLGDAAHVVHPLAGQGLNLGLLDAAALVEVLESAGDARSFGDMRLLRRYERWRNSENLPAAAALDGFDRLFSNVNPLLATLRAAGLGVVGRMPEIKSLLARRALGLSGDVPSFLASTADRSSPRR